MRRPVWSALLATATVALGACGSLVGPDDGLTGVYVVQTVQGMAVPFTLADDPLITISDRVLTLASDGTFTDVVELGFTGGDWSDVIPSTERGAFTEEGGHVRLAYADGRTAVAQRAGSKLTLDDLGLIFVFAR